MCGKVRRTRFSGSLDERRYSLFHYCPALISFTRSAVRPGMNDTVLTTGLFA